ncbi:MAG TPA: hypothetical protein VLM37_09310 [Fibrobacteraceae bacterium]|nr:hypothetical protein [Fibrobacteraceae bacterium]
MPDNLLSKIKRTVIEGASCTATKLEEGARIGKLKLDILAEEHRLDGKYCRLGEQAFLALKDEKLDSLKEEPASLEIVGSISESLTRIQDLREKLKTLQTEIGPKKC